MTKQEKEFKKAFKHRHVTNVELIASTLASSLRVYWRYNNRKQYNLMKSHILSIAKNFGNLEYQFSQYADNTAKYEYVVSHFRVT